MKNSIIILLLTSIISLGSISFANTNEVTTLPQANPGATTTSNSMDKSDAALAKEVQNKINQNEILKDFNFVVISHDGVVTLNATVDTQNQADAAVEAAKSTEGVKEVKSNIIVKTPNTNTM